MRIGREDSAWDLSRHSNSDGGSSIKASLGCKPVASWGAHIGMEHPPAEAGSVLVQWILIGVLDICFLHKNRIDGPRTRGVNAGLEPSSIAGHDNQRVPRKIGSNKVVLNVGSCGCHGFCVRVTHTIAVIAARPTAD